MLLACAPLLALGTGEDTHLESANVAVDGLPVDGVPFRRFDMGRVEPPKLAAAVVPGLRE
jgi:hypothetical protein